jgi:uncharacterized Zn finger protein
LTIEVERGLVRAKVQGSRVKPYDVALQVRPLSDDDWKQLAATLAGQAYFAAKLFAHEMPPDIEQVFQEAGLSLFPSKLGDLATKCSCPDYSNPCKHIAAVYYLLGERFDEGRRTAADRGRPGGGRSQGLAQETVEGRYARL